MTDSAGSFGSGKVLGEPPLLTRGWAATPVEPAAMIAAIVKKKAAYLPRTGHLILGSGMPPMGLPGAGEGTAGVRQLSPGYPRATSCQ